MKSGRHMIRKIKKDNRELETIMDIWLQATIIAHPFIEEEYWRKIIFKLKRIIYQTATRIFILKRVKLLALSVSLTKNLLEPYLYHQNNKDVV